MAQRVTSDGVAIEAGRRPAPSEAEPDDGVRWLALLLLKTAVILANGVRQRYALSKGERCPRCGHSF